MATTEYGRFNVTTRTDHTGLSNTTTYYVETNNSEPVEIGSGTDGKKLARTLAAALNNAGVHDFETLPPGFSDGERPTTHDAEEWEEWATENKSVPVRIAAAGKAATAGYLKVVYRRRESWISTELGVSEQTVRQYLSDLREGRR